MRWTQPKLNMSMANGKAIVKGFLRVGLIAGLLLISFGNSPAQVGNGTESPTNRETNGKADQNLKSIARVNPSTLAMEMNLPLMNYPGRNGNSLPIGFSYSSKLWRMQAGTSWWYWVNTHRKYVTDIHTVYAERTAAGWTSSLLPPRIDEKSELYNEEGYPYSNPIDEAGLNSAWQNILQSFLSSTDNAPDIYGCQGSVCCTTYWCSPNFPSDPQTSYTCHCTNWTVPNFPSAPDPMPPQNQSSSLYKVKRLQIAMSDGATHEFRASDSIFDCGTTGSGCTDNANETYLSVDGSGMKLVKTSSGSTLYLPDGGRYSFPAVSLNPTEGNYATDYIDADGNKLVFSSTTNPITGRTTNKWIDTLGREITDPLPHNIRMQSQAPSTRQINLPGLNGSPQQYEITWSLLKPQGCEEDSIGNCSVNNGQTGGALEDQTQKLFYDTRYSCNGNISNDLLAVPSNINSSANEVLFPFQDSGVRPCNGFSVYADSSGEPIPDANGSAQSYSTRFNPVVLSEVKLPNGQKYIFKYNRYGEISKIIYPTGSYETFKYDELIPISGLKSAAYDQTNRGVVEREVYEKITDSQYTLVQHWQYKAELTAYPNIDYKITTIAPKGNNALGEGIKTEKILYSDSSDDGNFGFNNPLAGMPKEERTYDENNILRSRTLTEWIVAPPRGGSSGTGERDPRVKQSVSVMIEGSQALATLSETAYDETATPGNNAQTDPEYFSHLNVKRAKSYHYAVVPLETAKTGTLGQIAGYFNSSLLANIAETDYQYNADTGKYKARGIPSLPTASRMLDKNGILISETQTVFDEDAYLISNSGSLTGNLTSSWTNPTTDLTIPAASRSLRGKPTTTKLWDSDHTTWLQAHTQYDQYGNVRKVWEVNEAVGSNRLVETQYDDPNNNTCGGPCPQSYAYPTKVITPAPDPTGVFGTDQGSFATTTYDFTTGLPLTATNEFGQTTATEYNDALLRPTRSFAVNFTAPETQTIYDDTNRTFKVRKQIDANNWDEATSFADSLGRTIKTQAKDSQGDVFTETEYDLLGRVKRTSNPYRSGETKLWSKPRYDELGRAVESFAPVAEGQPTQSLGITEYSISAQAGFVGTVVTTTDAAGRKSRSVTNGLGQLLRVDEPDSDNSLEAIPQATPTPTGSPELPDPCRLQNPPTTCSSRPAGEYPMYSTYYKYNVQGKLVEVTQGGQKRFFLYDSLGRLIRVRQPEQEVNAALNKTDAVTGNNQWTAGFSFDVLGNVNRATDANGVNIISEYDKLNRVNLRCYTKANVLTTATACSQVASSDFDPNTPPVYFTYDGKYYGADGYPYQATGRAKGALTQVRNGISTSQTTVYDSLGRPLVYQQLTDGQTYTSQYQYNFAGALETETYPNGRVVRNEFDSDGDLLRISGKANLAAQEKTYANSFAYTPDGKIAKLKLGNGLWEAAKFNSRLQITELGLGIGTDNLNRWKVNYDYGEIESNGTLNTAKNTGNIARQTISFQGLTNPFVQTYKYDSLSRLREAAETSGTATNWTQMFGYDRFGNRTSFSQQGGTVPIVQPTINTNTNRFNINQGYAYDKNGNVTTDAASGATRTFTFNGENKQTEVKDANGTLVGKYFYDGDGKRVKKQTYDQNGNVKEITVFVYSGGKLIAEYSTEPPPTNPTTNYVATDILQSVRAITNALGEVTSRRDFMPFGEELISDASYRTATQKYSSIEDKVRQKFTGYQKDAETSLDFAEARMYNNQYGRFTAVDPLLASGKSANPQTFNRYAYVMNNPLILTDPTGLQAGWAIDQRDVSPTGEKTPWTYFRYFENPTFLETFNAINGANFTPFSGEFYIYGDNSFAYLSGSVYSEGKISTFIESGKIDALKALQKEGNINEVDNGMRSLMLGGFAPLIGSQDDAVNPQRVLASPVILIANPGNLLPSSGLFRSSSGFAAGRSAVVTEKGLDIVKSHLAQFGDDDANAGMVSRLENAMANGGRITGADRNFYMHELRESTLMGRGTAYGAAHSQSLIWDRGIYTSRSNFSIYHPEVINANPRDLSPNFRTFWNLPTR